MREAARKSFTFRLVLAGPSELTDELEMAVLDAGCDDALLGVVDGEPFLIFHREAPTFRDALLSAVDATERAGLELIRVEPE
ncbi:MAG TPA: hypothetical protein VG406_22040 [Isosphaeraceae bacterium]|jgi:hypothetical protein|nr:hypothetical protein [Isosphaeraceae bacterium]